jgi:hypothetical protein
MKGLGIAIISAMISAPAAAATAAFVPAPLVAGPVLEIQFRCTPNSCIDLQTGVYTQSTCDRYGCRPLGGAVGRLGPGGYDQPRYPSNQYGQFDCSPTRCIDMASGRVWESTCDYGGCRPLRPSRQRYY